MTLTIEQLNKTYPNGIQALKDVSLQIKNGLFGLLGPNGAGKSTLMRTIATLQDADSGQAYLDNLNVLTDKHEVRKILGYLPQEFGVYKNITAMTLMDHIAVLKGIVDNKNRKRIVERLLQQTNLYDVRKEKLGSFSGGMKQRFGVAQALLGSPKIIIVDEPTAGLDPAERKRFLNLLSEIGEQVVVILSTHIVDDVKDICNQMGIIDKGEVKYEGKPALAIKQLEGKVWQKTIAKPAENEYAGKYQLLSGKLNEGMLDIRVYSDSPLLGFENIRPVLEDVYFSAINGYISLN